MKYDVIRLLSDFGIDYDITSEKWINVSCPFCGDGKKHGGINLKESYYNCFRCGYHDIRYTLKEMTGLSEEVFKSVEKDYSISFSFRKEVQKSFSRIDTIDLPGQELNEKERKYLEDRRFDPELLSDVYGIRGGGLVGDLKFRIIIPIYLRGKLVSYTSRAIFSNTVPRYKTLSSEQSVVPAKNTLFNIDHCKEDRVIVVEGPFDAMRIGDNCCATLGIGMTKNQQRMLEKFKEVFFVYDPEDRAQSRAEFQANCLIEKGINAYVVDTELDHDPGDMTDEEVEKLKKELKIAV